MKKLLRYFVSKSWDQSHLLGKWYGLRELPPDSSVMTCSSYEETGEAAVHFKQKFADGESYEGIEKGHWALRKSKLTKTMKDQYGSTTVHVYRVVNLTDAVLEYVSEATEVTFTMKKSNAHLDSDWESFLLASSGPLAPPEPRSTAKPTMPDFDATADFSDPASITAAFICDYEKWNAYAERTSDENFDLRYATEAYGVLTQKYCSQDARIQGVSFGSKSAHRETCEQIESCRTSESTATVKTVRMKELAGVFMQDEFEYLYTMTVNGWRLSKLVVIIDGERIDSL